MFSEKIWKKVREGAEEVALRETALDAIEKGEISKENLEGEFLEKETYKKLKDLGFGLGHPK